MNCLPPFYRQPSVCIYYTPPPPHFYRKKIEPYPSVIFQKSQSPINKGGFTLDRSFCITPKTSENQTFQGLYKETNGIKWVPNFKRKYLPGYSLLSKITHHHWHSHTMHWVLLDTYLDSTFS